MFGSELPQFHEYLPTYLPTYIHTYPSPIDNQALTLPEVAEYEEREEQEDKGDDGRCQVDISQSLS